MDRGRLARGAAMIRRKVAVAASVAAAMWLGHSAQACSDETPCIVAERAYFIAMPEGAQTPPAVMFIHGFGGSGAGALRNKAMVDAYLTRGFAVIAPDGQPREGRTGRSWNFHPRTGQQDAEISHLMAVRDDAVDRFELDAQHIVLAGFSIGGSMVSYTACANPEAFAAYAPLSGSFWRPHPEGCAGPVRLFHTHGWTDGTVPLEGRVVNQRPLNDPDAFAQGDVFHSLDLFRQANGCTYAKPDRMVVQGEYWQRVWDACAAGSSLRLAVFPRGHVIPRSWPDLVIDWFEAL